MTVKTKPTKQAVSYLRVSGKGQEDGDGFTRQRKAIKRCAKAKRLVIVAEYTDTISGTTPLDKRPGLSALIDHLLGNGVRTVLVEKADRLARDLIEGELILRTMRRLKSRVIVADGGTELLKIGDDSPTDVLLRQVLGSVAEFEKSALVQKLRAARNRMREQTGRCEGFLAFGLDPARPDEAAVVKTIRRLHRKLKGQRQRSAAAIATELGRLGLTNRAGQPWDRHSVREVLKRTRRRK